MEAKTRQRFSAWPSRGLRAGGLIAIGLLLGVLLFPEAVAPFVAINLTPSLPRGLYRITRLRVQPGALVTLWPGGLVDLDLGALKRGGLHAELPKTRSSTTSSKPPSTGRGRMG